MSRVILHCDCNSFFASVETALNPAYRGVPMAVCGSQSDRHGIVLAKNELAKKYNIATAETVYSAKKKCPGLVIAEPHYDEYVKFSRRVNEIYARYTDMIEPFGIDESWLDVTASQKIFGSGTEIAERIRREVKEEIGITVSIGVSFNKAFAKLGSDYKKPDAITVISEENFKNIVFPLPASTLLFVGKKTSEALLSMGVRTIGELAETSREMLMLRFGKLGGMLYSYANGLDDSPVASSAEDAKSVSNGFTFRHDLITREECRVGIEYLSEEIGRRLRRQGQLSSTVSLTIKDEYLRSIQRQKPQVPATDVGEEIARTAYEILREEWVEGKPIRMITVSASNLIRKDSHTMQLSFFDDKADKKHEKSEKKENAVDKIRQKYGSDSIIRGSVINSDIGIYDKK
ncbi:MAG: DNA polymerase IV [Clostridia bacterium]|nr:DNA polymerase IV [Clostridia bacterium]